MIASSVARALTAATLGLAVLATAACATQPAVANGPHTGSTTATAVGGVQQVTLTVADNYRFSPSTITVHSGMVKVTLVHKGTGAPHNFSLVGFPTDATPLAEPGQTVSTTFVAPGPGTYTFVCTIHVAQGQVGKLIVLP
jgi:plastocyanin